MGLASKSPGLSPTAFLRNVDCTYDKSRTHSMRLPKQIKFIQFIVGIIGAMDEGT